MPMLHMLTTQFSGNKHSRHYVLLHSIMICKSWNAQQVQKPYTNKEELHVWVAQSPHPIGKIWKAKHCIFQNTTQSHSAYNTSSPSQTELLPQLQCPNYVVFAGCTLYETRRLAQSHLLNSHAQPDDDEIMSEAVRRLVFLNPKLFCATLTGIICYPTQYHLQSQA